MRAPENRLKMALAAGRVQTGLWLDLASPRVAELAATCGFDWCLIDGEHAPNGLPEIEAQIVALERHGTPAVVRVPVGEDWILKQVLDLGAQSVMVPMVEDAAEAERLVRAVRYPPGGIRGVAPAVVRAAQYHASTEYVETANAQICLMLQIESIRAVRAIPEIAAVEGVDVLFIGPADLSADMGFSGDTGAPEVVTAVEAAIAAIVSAGKVAGILTGDPAQAARYAGLGATFLGVGADVTSLAAALRQLAVDAQRLKD